MRKTRMKISRLREQLNRAMEQNDLQQAALVCAELEAVEPTEPRWPHRRGDILRRIGRDFSAVQAYCDAVDRYAARGFVARATAMAKVVLEIDPTHRDIMSRVNPAPARELRKQERPRAAQHPGVANKQGVVAPHAPSLRPASKAPKNETRFNDMPTGEISLSALELSGRPPVSGVFDEDAPTAQQLAQLPAVPLFADVPPIISNQLMRAASRMEVPAGQAVQRAGDRADALYIIVEGRVAVQGIDPESDHATSIGEGNVFGEACLLSGTRAVTATTMARSVLLRIPQSALHEAASQHAQVGQVLFELLTRRLIASLFATSVLFKDVPTEGRREIARFFEVRRVASPLQLVEAGKRSDGLYILLAGRCTVQTAASPAPQQVRPGAVFGQQSLLTGAVASRTVCGDRDTLVLRLPARYYTQLVSKFPPMLVPLAQMASEPLPKARSSR